MKSDRRRTPANLDAEFWDGVSRVAPLRAYAAGQTVFSVGDPGDAIYIIRSGRIEVGLHSAAGKRTAVNRMGPGEIFGEVAFLDEGPRTADAVAAEPSELAVFDRPTYLNQLRSNETFTGALIDALCSHIRNSTDVLEVISMPHAEDRLAVCLLRLSQKWGKDVAPDRPARVLDISQDELAEFAGLTRQCVNQTLSRWQRDGLVQTQRGRVTICNPDDRHWTELTNR